MKRSSLNFYPSSLFLLNILIIGLLVSPVQAKKRCKPLLDKLHNVQAMQRTGYSLKRGETLRKKEDKARDKWWQCEHSSRFSEGKTKKKKKSKKNRVKARTTRENRVHTSSKNVYLTKKITATPFAGSESIVIKSKYHGKMKFAWLDFYQKPNKCQRPSSLSVFASCNEDKRAQQLTFEDHYAKAIND
jgi:hypothetical protein